MDHTAGNDAGNGHKAGAPALGNRSGKNVHGVHPRGQVEDDGGNDKAGIVFNSKHGTESLFLPPYHGDVDRERSS